MPIIALADGHIKAIALVMEVVKSDPIARAIIARATQIPMVPITATGSFIEPYSLAVTYFPGGKVYSIAI